METQPTGRSRSLTTEKPQLKPPRISEIYYLLFKKPPQQRSKFEKKMMKKYIKSLPYFNRAMVEMLQNRSLFEHLLDSLEYTFIPANTVIYHEGDPSERFYVLVKGQVKLYQPRSQVEIDADLFALKRLAQQQEESPKEAERSPDISPTKIQSHHSNHLFDFHPQHHSHPIDHMQTSPSPRKITDDDNHHFQVLSRQQTFSPRGFINSSMGQSRRKGMVISTAGLSQPEDITFQEALAQQFEGAINKGISDKDHKILASLHSNKKKYLRFGGVHAFKPLKDIAVGGVFGAFVDKDIDRTETAVAMTDCHLLSLNQEDFFTIFEDPLREKEQRLQIFKTLIGEDVDFRYIRIFEELFKIKTVNLYEIIYNQDDYPDGLYMVRRGEIRLLYHETKKTESGEQKLSTSTHTNKVEVARIPPNQFFGCEDLLELHQRSFTAEALTKAEIMFLPRQYLINPAIGLQKMISRIREGYKQTREWEMQRVEEIKQKMAEDEKKRNSIKYSGGQFHLRIFPKKGHKEFYGLERISNGVSPKTIEPAAVQGPKQLTDGDPIAKNPHRPVPKLNFKRKTRTQAPSPQILSPLILSPRSHINSPKLQESPGLSQIQSKEIAIVTELPTPQRLSLLSPKSDLVSEQTPEITHPKSARLSLDSNTDRNNALETPKKKHYRMLSDFSPNKHSDSKAPTSLWKYNVVEGSTKLRNLMLNDKVRRSIPELVDMYDEGGVFCRVDPQKNKQTYSVKNSFSNASVHTPRSDLAAINTSKNGDNSVKIGVHSHLSSPSRASEFKGDKANNLELKPPLRNSEFGLDAKKPLSFFAKNIETPPNGLGPSLTPRNMNTTTRYSFSRMAPKTERGNSDPPCLLDRKGRDVVPKVLLSPNRSIEHKPFGKPELNSEIVPLFKELTKAASNKLKTIANELPLSNTITTKIILRNSSLASTRDGWRPQPNKFNFLLQGKEHLFSK